MSMKLIIGSDFDSASIMGALQNVVVDSVENVDHENRFILTISFSSYLLFVCLLNFVFVYLQNFRRDIPMMDEVKM